MHAVFRYYTGASKLIDEMDKRSAEVEQVISTSPGFVAYHAVRNGDMLVTMSLCQDKAGTDETTRRAAEWVKANLPPGSASTPQVSEGEAFINFATPHTIGAAAPVGS